MARAFTQLADWPRATTEHMPFPGHRTCAEWGPNVIPKVRTDKDRIRDAERGSANLLEAIRKAAA